MQRVEVGQIGKLEGFLFVFFATQNFWPLGGIYLTFGDIFLCQGKAKVDSTFLDFLPIFE